jgi:hypothetical protein
MRPNTIHSHERRRLAPPTVKQLPNRGHSITVMGFRILGDLQQDPDYPWGYSGTGFAAVLGSARVGLTRRMRAAQSGSHQFQRPRIAT